ncbi:hypothetical protein ADK52_04925 [Streptomyces sp. WM6372]|nr:hypothetical protein ADK52_04925 [Streptomyces sp. WM6372]
MAKSRRTMVEKKSNRFDDELRFYPTIFLPASTPWPAEGMFVEVLMPCESMTHALGSCSRPSCLRN